MKQRNLVHTHDFERDDNADTDVQSLFHGEFGPDPTSDVAHPGPVGGSGTGPVGLESGFDRADTSVRGRRASDRGADPTRSQRADHHSATQAAPVLCDLSYESRMEANLYITRTLLAESRCRILVSGQIVTIERSDDVFVARDPHGDALAVDPQVPMLLIALLEQAPR